MTDVLVVGEALIDIVDDRRLVGGGPLNIATGVARLGNDVALLTRIGSDPDGARIESHLSRAGVQLVPGSRQRGGTSTARAVLDPSGSATYEFDITWDLPGGTVLGAAELLHIGSLAAFLDPGGARLVDLLEDASPPLLTFDPNIRPSLVDRTAVLARLNEIVRRADVIKLSSEDADYIWPDSDEDEIAGRLLDSGISLLVLTKGEHGSRLWSDGHRATVGVPPGGAVVDTIGAGDSFMAGLIHGLLRVRREDWSRRLGDLGTFAASCAALTVRHEGAYAPTREEVDALLDA